jgi:TonB family protein
LGCFRVVMHSLSASEDLIHEYPRTNNTKHTKPSDQANPDMKLLWVTRLALPIFLKFFLLVPNPADYRIQAAANFTKPPFPQEAIKPQEQEKPAVAALTEVKQLSLTVVRLFGERKFDEALPLAKRALELADATLGSEHETVQGARLNLAEIYMSLKKYGDARKLVERLLATHEKTVGPDDAGTAVFLDKLGFVDYVQRDFGKAEAAYKRSLEIREKVFGREHPEFAASVFRLAEFYRLVGKFEVAQPLYEQAALLREKLLGREHPDYQLTRDKYYCLVYETTQGDKRKKKLDEFAQKLGTTSTSTVEAGVLNGRAISLPRPAYSDEARRQRLQGTVVIKVTIDETGKVIAAADMCNGNPLLVEASLPSARAARFAPTLLNGQPVKVTGVITYNYVQR